MNWIFSREKRSRRLYVDLLFRETDMYANFLPSSRLELGDYGDVTKSGDFVISGNILKEYPEFRETLDFGKETPENDKYFFSSRKRGTASSLNAALEIPTIAKCSVKLGWNVKGDIHAVLVMINPELHELRPEGRLQNFVNSIPNLMDKAFVTKVYHCSTYALHITNGQSGQVYVGFQAGGSPVTGVPVEVGVGADHYWQTSSQSGSWSTGKYDSLRPYTPLATLRQIQSQAPTSGYRDGTPLSSDIDSHELADYIPPWGDLDEFGRDICDEEEMEAELEENAVTEVEK